MRQNGTKTDGSVRISLFKLAIIGATSLKGKELKEVLGERGFPALETRLLDEDESLGQLDAVGDEPTIIHSVLPERLESVDFSFFAGVRDFTLRSWQMAQQAGSEIIDLSYALEAKPGVQLRSPWLEQELGRGHPVELKTAPVVVAHPAAVTLALLMTRLQRAHPVRRFNATIFEPASERGRAGMDELHDQTMNLLSFKPLPTNIYGTQVAFNLVSVYGTETGLSLDELGAMILRHYSIISGGALQPSVQVIHAPVFHGHTFSIYLQLEKPAPPEEMIAVLTGDHVTPATAGEEPSNVNVAGVEEIQVALRPDTGQPDGYWLWAASDNLRISVLQAVECAEDMAATRPRGQVQ